MPLTRIKSTAIETGGITTAKIADDAVTSTKIDDSQITLGFRNKIIGGNFSTNPWQRGFTFNSAASGIYSADRWQNFDTTTTTMNIGRALDAPTVAQAGVFSQHCLHLDVDVADTALTASQYYMIGQKPEGYNVMDFGFGQSGTRYVTLSFWHKHTKTGIYCVALQNGAENRSYVAEYTQSSSDAWEKAEITIPVDTSGTWLYDSGVGIRLYFSVAIGSDFYASANSWSAGNYLCTSNQVNALDSTSNNFKIALVQLEAGQTATAFENRSVGQELALCQRYYWRGELSTGPTYLNTGGNISLGTGFLFPVRMRATPSGSVISNEHASNSNSGALLNLSVDGGNYNCNMSVSAGTVQRTDIVDFSAEL